jgi:anti-anti-sigma factor
MKLTALPSAQKLKRVGCSGDITALDLPPGAQPLETVLGPSGYTGTVLLDLSESPYIDSSGVGWLMVCHRRFEKAGGRMVLHSIPPMINHSFQLLGMYDVFHIAPDETAAHQLATTAHSV